MCVFFSLHNPKAIAATLFFLFGEVKWWPEASCEGEIYARTVGWPSEPVTELLTLCLLLFIWYS